MMLKVTPYDADLGPVCLLSQTLKLPKNIRGGGGGGGGGGGALSQAVGRTGLSCVGV